MTEAKRYWNNIIQHYRYKERPKSVEKLLDEYRKEETTKEQKKRIYELICLELILDYHWHLLKFNQ